MERYRKTLRYNLIHQLTYSAIKKVICVFKFRMSQNDVSTGATGEARDYIIMGPDK